MTETPTCQMGEALDDPCGQPATHYTIDEEGNRVYWCREHAVDGFDKRLEVEP